MRCSVELFQAAAERLVSQRSADIPSAARQLVASAPAFGIDLTICWMTLNPGHARPRVRQACLGVPGSGRTAMFFLSEPHANERAADAAEATGERGACLEAVCRHLATLNGRVVIGQALPEPTENWALDAYRAAGFMGVGTLAYLRREPGPIDPGSSATARAEFDPWPEGVEVLRLDDAAATHTAGSIESAMIEALDRSYERTLDCPELCGLRDTRDVLNSHQSTGQFDPSFWWLVRLHGRPAGCVLLNPCEEQRTVELVYLGISPDLRGKRLSRRLLTVGIARARAMHPGWAVTCAVDERNTPAIRLYEGLGFRPFARRVALVRAIR